MPSRVHPHAIPVRSVVAFSALALALAGCETLPPAPESSLRAQFGQMAVVASPAPPRGNLDTFARGDLAGAGKGASAGAGFGALAALGTTGTAAPAAMAAGATIAAGAILIITGLVVGGVYGANTAIPKELAAQIDATIATALRDAHLNTELAAALRQAAATHREAHEHGLDEMLTAADTQLEVQVTEAGFRGGEGSKLVLRFYLTARVRVLGSDAREIFVRDFAHLSPPHRWAEWSANDGALLVAGFGEAIDGLAGRVLDELFVVTRFPFASGFWAFPGTPEYGSCWLRPIDPPHKIGTPKVSWNPHTPYQDTLRDMVKYLPVASLTPTLRWEPFPRPRDRVKQNEALLARISEVTYDLKIWEAKGGYPERLVYDRSGLTAPEHALEHPLDADHDYYWSFRARYRMDGAPQATRWAFSLIPAPPGGMDGSGGYCELDNIPPSNYYRFTTRKP